MSDRGNTVLAWLVVLVATATAILALDGGRHSHADGFQRLVGGLGFGPALELSPCALGFDPRLEGSCDQDTGRIPGGRCFCPHHVALSLRERKAQLSLE